MLDAMKNQDSVTIVITFLLLLPWLWRGVASAMAVWRTYEARLMELLARDQMQKRMDDR
jgi:hypothetical protein